MDHNNHWPSLNFIGGLLSFLAYLSLNDWAAVAGIFGVGMAVFFGWRRDRREKRRLEFEFGMRTDRRTDQCARCDLMRRASDKP